MTVNDRQQVREALEAGQQLREGRFFFWMTDGAVMCHCENGCCESDWTTFEDWWAGHGGQKFEIVPETV